MLWYFMTRSPVKVVVTAPTSSQLYDAMFAELKRWINAMPLPLQGLLTVKQERIEFNAAPTEMFISARTSRAEQPEAFEEYTESPFFQLYADMLIYSAARLTEFIPAANGSHTFYKTIKAQLTIQQRVVGGMLGAAFYNDLQAQNQKILKGEAVSDQYRTALDMVCRLIASRALVTALPWMNISEDFRTKTRIGGLEDKTILTDARRSELKLQESLSADAAKFALFNYLNNSATDLVFPAYFNSTYYTAPQADKPISRLANDPNNKYAFI